VCSYGKLKGFCQGRSKWKALRESQTKSKPKLKAKEKGLKMEYEGPLLTRQGNNLKCLLKNPKLTIDNLEVGKLKKHFHLGAIKWCNNKCCLCFASLNDPTNK
jgi:hypothetical protein